MVVRGHGGDCFRDARRVGNRSWRMSICSIISVGICIIKIRVGACIRARVGNQWWRRSIRIIGVGIGYHHHLRQQRQRQSQQRQQPFWWPYSFQVSFLFWISCPYCASFLFDVHIFSMACRGRMHHIGNHNDGRFDPALSFCGYDVMLGLFRIRRILAFPCPLYPSLHAIP